MKRRKLSSLLLSFLATEVSTSGTDGSGRMPRYETQRVTYPHPHLTRGRGYSAVHHCYRIQRRYREPRYAV